MDTTASVPPKRRFEISPSQLAFDLAGCPRCVWYRARGEPPPKLPFPAVFQAIDAAMKRALIGRPASVVVPDCEGTIVAGRFVRGAPVRILTETGEWELGIKGRTDLGIELPDGRLGIVDLKTTRPRPDLAEHYHAQLEAYAFAVEHPAEDAAVEVAFLGLSCFVPKEFSVDHAAFAGRMTFVPLDRDPEALLARLREIAAVVGARGEPDPAEGCTLCAIRSGSW